MVQELLQLIFKSFSLTMQRLLIDHLPGGEFFKFDVSDPMIIAETLSVPKTNVSPERDFAILDRLMSQKPNATCIALESLLLFSHNKTSEWLYSKTSEERERLLQAARKLTTVHRKNLVIRREEIEKKRMEAVEKRERELLKKRERELKMKDLTIMIQKVGLWTTSEEVTKGLDQVSTKKAKLDALKLQINFCKKVLNQSHPDKTVFQFSQNHKVLSIDQLAQNLSKLLQENPHQELSLERIRIHADPELLIYRRVEHLFDCDGKDVWYKGTVLAFDRENGKFRITYDNDNDIYYYPLLEDLDNGELRIL